MNRQSRRIGCICVLIVAIGLPDICYLINPAVLPRADYTAGRTAKSALEDNEVAGSVHSARNSKVPTGAVDSGL